MKQNYEKFNKAMREFVGVLDKYVTYMAWLWQTLRSHISNTKPNWLRQKDLNLFDLVVLFGSLFKLRFRKDCGVI